jgi:hypothetical protein
MPRLIGYQDTQAGPPAYLKNRLYIVLKTGMNIVANSRPAVDTAESYGKKLFPRSPFIWTNIILRGRSTPGSPARNSPSHDQLPIHGFELEDIELVRIGCQGLKRGLRKESCSRDTYIVESNNPCRTQQLLSLEAGNHISSVWREVLMREGQDFLPVAFCSPSSLSSRPWM